MGSESNRLQNTVKSAEEPVSVSSLELRASSAYVPENTLFSLNLVVRDVKSLQICELVAYDQDLIMSL